MESFAAISVLDALANSLKEILLSTAKEILRNQKKKIQPLVTNEVLGLCDQRRQLRRQKYKSIEAGLK